MIDIHSHLLPRLDDGSRSVEQSVATLRRLRLDGVTEIVLTPHLTASEIEWGAEEAIARRAAAYEHLRPHVPASMVLHLGFEIMLDEPLPALACGDRRLALAGSRYYLVEVPLSLVGDFVTRALSQIAETGVVPVLAHPERYDACTPQQVSAWRQAGAKIQLDATTLTRPTSRGVRARQLIQAGLADVIAADNHGDGRSMRSGADFLRKRLGHAALANEIVRRLTVENPAALVRDGNLVPTPQARLEERWLDQVRRLLSD